MSNVCVFCGASPGASPIYTEVAMELGERLAAMDLGLVYGGGKVGVMGAVAEGALRAKGRVMGVIPQGLMLREVAHMGLTELHIVASMHERKALMEKMSQAFIAMPGGFGTLDELCEIITWWQLGLHRKPIALLNVDGYFDGFLAFIDHAVNEKFIAASFRDGLICEVAPARLLERVRSALV